MSSGVFDLLSPEVILNTAEQFLEIDLEPLLTPYNSYINRVYQVKTIDDGRRYIIKFYRPSRWTETTIKDEHDFLYDCAEDDIPVVSPLKNKNGESLDSVSLCTDDGEEISFYYSVYPFRSGRTFDICSDDDYLRLGSLIGRLHVVSKKRNACERTVLDPISLSLKACKELVASGSVHNDVSSEFLDLTTSVLESSAPLFFNTQMIRLHGDCHRGNILDRLNEGLLLIDFDDMMIGPAIQDLWLLLPDHAQKSKKEMNLLLEGYTQFCEFEFSTLSLIEPLRFMRILYFLSWCNTQKDDVQFMANNPLWGTRSFWIRELEDLRYQAQMLY